MIYSEDRRVEWGDCDEAGIVFYPNYFRWMDGAFHAMCGKVGYDQRKLRMKLGVFGTPLVEAKGEFRGPATFGETLKVSVGLARIGRTSFSLAYRFSRGDAAILDGEETRVFVRRDDSGAISKTPIPDAFREALQHL
ncbi:MAG: thioesterase family protein [Pseudomonadota bacterium]